MRQQMSRSWLAPLLVALLGATTEADAHAPLPTIALIMTGDPDHYHRMAFKKRGGYLEAVESRPARFKAGIAGLVAFARPSLFVFWQRECSEWKSCPGAKAAQNGTHDYQVYVETPGLEVAKVYDRCLVPLRRVYNEWTNKWSENVQYQNLWCSWLMAVSQEELNGRPFDFVARVRTDVYVVWEKTWFTHLDDRTIAGAADTLQENRVAKLTKNDCYVSNKFLTSCVTDVFFMGRRAPFETLLSATRNVTMMYERHMTWAAGVHGLYFTPVVAGSNKASCPQCKMNLFIRDGNIFCILDNAAPPSSRTATHGIDAAVMTCKAVGPTANWANRQIVPYHGTAVGPHDHFRVRPEDYGT